jgi:pantoate--beta-alanine ligase
VPSGFREAFFIAPGGQGESTKSVRSHKMILVKTISELRQYLNQNRTEGRSIGFVPTMGCLHQGHCALIKRSAMENDITVLSIFLNPTQFSSKEDYEKYPRRWDEDISAAEEAGATVVFEPEENEIYPAGFQTFVDVRELANPLCGESRPGHFIGMATIVLKLFNIVQPDRAYFGQKDYQQICIVKQMVRDLDLQIDVVSCPTVREDSGLACSSRNTRLTVEEKTKAAAIYRLLQTAEDAVDAGTTDSSILHKLIRRGLKHAGMEVEYVEIVDAKTLLPVKKITGETLIAVAVFLGTTRLIDNMIVQK